MFFVFSRFLLCSKNYPLSCINAFTFRLPLFHLALEMLFRITKIQCCSLYMCACVNLYLCAWLPPDLAQPDTVTCKRKQKSNASCKVFYSHLECHSALPSGWRSNKPVSWRRWQRWRWRQRTPIYTLTECVCFQHCSCIGVATVAAVAALTLLQQCVNEYSCVGRWCLGGAASGDL